MTPPLNAFPIMLALAGAGLTSAASAATVLPAGSYVFVHSPAASQTVSVTSQGNARIFQAALTANAAPQTFRLTVADDGSVSGNVGEGDSAHRSGQAVSGAVVLDGANADVQLDATIGAQDAFTLYAVGHKPEPQARAKKDAPAAPKAKKDAPAVPK